MPRKRASKAKSANIPKPEKRVFGTLNETEEDEKAEQLELMLKEFDSKGIILLKIFYLLYSSYNKSFFPEIYV